MKRTVPIIGLVLLACLLFLSGCFLFQSQPGVDFTASSVTGPRPLVVAFTAIMEDSAISYAWDFGDGSSSSEADPVRVYQVAGDYTVSLMVELADGRVGSATKIDYISVAQVLGKTTEPLLYWVNDYGAFKSGSRNGFSESTLFTGFLGVRSMEIVNEMIYWVDAGAQKISRINLDGSEEETVIHGRETYYLPFDIAVDQVRGKVYWICVPHDTPQEADDYSWVWIGGIYRANLDGTNIESLITYPAGASEYAKYIEVDAVQGLIYWVLENDKDDSWKLQRSLIKPAFNPVTIQEYSGGVTSLALDTVYPIGASHAYFTQGGALKMIGVNGGPAVSLLTGLNYPQDVVVDLLEGRVYVGTWDGIVRARIDGTEMEVIFPEEDAGALAL